MSKIREPRPRELREEIESMPEWLKPVGAFGIGTQSVFGIAHEFHAKSVSREDHKERDIYKRYSEEHVSKESLIIF
jgi:hypothetical protein